MEVVLHHVLVALVGTFSILAATQTFAAQYFIQLNAILLLMVVTDHLMNLAILLKNLGYADTSWWPKFCKGLGVLFVICKIIPFVLVFVEVADARNGNNASWRVSNHSFSKWLDTNDVISLRVVNIVIATLVVLLFLVQLYIGYVLWVLGCKYERKNRQIDSGKECIDSNAEEVDRTYSMRVHSCVEGDLLDGPSSSVIEGGTGGRGGTWF